MSKNTSLKDASFKQITQEFNKRKKEKISELQTELKRINDKIAEISGVSTDVVSPTADVSVKTTNNTNKTSRKVKKSMRKNRVTNDKPLKDRLLSIAADGQEHSTNECLTVLEKDGWKSSSAKPYYVVAAGLASLEKKGMLRRTKKGSYALPKNA